MAVSLVIAYNRVIEDTIPKDRPTRAPKPKVVVKKNKPVKDKPEIEVIPVVDIDLGRGGKGGK